MNRRSRPIVVGWPWPEWTTVSSGNVNSTFLIDESSVCMSPPGRSVRPIDPANNVSPTNEVRSLFSVAAHRETDTARTVPGRVIDPGAVLAEAPRPLPVVEEVHLRLRFDLQPEHLSLLHDRFVEEVVVPVQPDRHAQRLLRRADAGDVIEVRVRQEDVADVQHVLLRRLQEERRLVSGVDDDAFARLLAAKDVPVFEEGLHRAGFENHREPVRPPFSHYQVR